MFGAKGEKVRDARDAAVSLAPDHVVYHEPGAGPLQLPGVDGVNVYVLGPPRKADLLGLTERASEMYGVGQALGAPMGRALMAGFGMAVPDAGGGDDWDLPFDPELGVKLADILPVAADSAAKDTRPIVSLLRDHYVGPAAVRAWSRAARSPIRATDRASPISPGDGSTATGWPSRPTWPCNSTTGPTIPASCWHSSSPGASVYCCSRLMRRSATGCPGSDVAFGTGPNVVKGPDLLARTVYLKVGHHGSHNATLKAKGLERMTEPDLAAFIPINEQDAQRIGWGQMPFRGILEDLESRTAGRVIRADDVWLRDGRLPDVFATPSGAVRGVRYDRSGEGLWVELDVA